MASNDENSRQVVSVGVFSPAFRYTGSFAASDRYYFPDHPRIFVQGPTAGHGIEDEVLRRVGQHPSDPFGLRTVGIDNTSWQPDRLDLDDMAYVEWSNGVSVYSEIARTGGLLDRLGLRDTTAPPVGNVEVEQLRADLAAAREQLTIAQVGWTAAAQKLEKIDGVLGGVAITPEGGGKPMRALREISLILGPR
jgi:hypothetical protein